MIVSPHHKLICDTLDRVLEGEITRLIINIPPGYSKTMIAVINFISRGLAINPRAKFIHASYSDDLAKLNSGMTKEVIQTKEYQELWGMELKKDSKSKKAWYNEHSGGLYAVAAGGQITGFRAGRSDGEDNKDFSGAFILDDPIKPDDAFSETKRDAINVRFTNTFKSRLMHNQVPFIVIMQRVHDNDPTGFLLEGGSGEKWHHLNLPVLVQKKEDRPPYPAEWTHGIPIDYDLPEGPLWEYKHTMEEIIELQKDAYTYNSQYNQSPAPIGGGLFKSECWGYYDVIPRLKVILIFGDTATKKGSTNDYSVFLAAGLTYDDKIAILDVHRKKYETPELLVAARQFWNKHVRKHGTNRIGATSFKIEDKSSGTYLIQQFRREGIPVQDIQRNTDKVQRALATAPEVSRGNVLLPTCATPLTDAMWVHDYITEHSKFTVKDTHAHDDQIDVTMDAIETLLIDRLFSIYDNLRF